MEKILETILSFVKSSWEKKITRRIIIISLSLLTVILIVLLATSANSKKFVGTWEEIDEYGDIAYNGETIVFANDGTGSARSGGMSGSLTWSVEKNKVFITVSICGVTDTQEFEYKFSGDTMTLIDENGEKTVYRKRP